MSVKNEHSIYSLDVLRAGHLRYFGRDWGERQKKMSKLIQSLNKPGMLPRQFLREAVEAGYVGASINFPDSLFQPASLDLRVKNIVYRLRSTFLPHPQYSIQSSIDSLAEHIITLDDKDGAILENNHYYLVPIEETLELPPTLRGRASPKSSIGRLDVFVRILAERTTRFDDVPSGYKGNLYALVGPRSFAIVLRPGDCLAQLRLITTAPGAIVSDDELNRFWSNTPLLYRPRRSDGSSQPIGYERAVLDEGIFLSADFLRPPRAPLGYKPRRVGSVIDLAKVRFYEAADYWAPVLPDYGLNAVRLVPDEFYLVRCQEKLSIPPSLAAEMLAYDARLGELRSHYAGFFDPGFGYNPDLGLLGTHPVLEVRTQESFVVQHGHTLCRLQIFRMVEEPDIVYGDVRLGSSYQEQQRYPFSKHFRTPADTVSDKIVGIQNELDLGYD